MTEVIGVRFKKAGKVYYFAPKQEKITTGDYVVVQTSRGLECGEVVFGNRMVEDVMVASPLKPLVRIATPTDLKTLEKNEQKQAEAKAVCEQKIQKHRLDMKLVDVEYAFDGTKLLFYFTADGRVDFRELVKDLASVFKTRIELRQIGVRDESKMLGGLGICGRPFCCTTFLGDFQPVSIKMAKEQGLSLNPTKISGTCGRLMCCLKYEQDAYEDLLAHTPRAGSIVKTEEGKGVVTEVSLLTGKLHVRLDERPEAVPKVFQKDEVQVLKPARNCPKKKDGSRPKEARNNKSEK